MYIYPLEYKIKVIGGNINPKLIVNLNDPPTGSGNDFDESKYFYYEAPQEMIIPDNNLLLVLLISLSIVFVTTRKRL